MSSIGLFDVKGLTDVNPSFQIGSPLFDKVTIKQAKKSGRKDFVIDITNNSKTNVYLEDVNLNGKNLDKLSIDLKDITRGGILKMNVGDKPSSKWSN
jgi:putative alpha-1,2-mannosidase